MSSKIIQVNERPPLSQAIPLSIQHMFAMFGASVLVPSVFGIDPAIVLLMNGVGTLLFILITKGRAPHTSVPASPSLRREGLSFRSMALNMPRAALWPWAFVAVFWR